MEGMPRNVKLPLFDYGPSGAVGFFQLTLKDISSYRDLQTEVFHAFRVIGNAIICFMMIEESMVREGRCGMGWGWGWGVRGEG